VIFDCDGTLVDSEQISGEALAQALSEQGLPTSAEQAERDYQGLLLSEIDRRAAERLGRALPEGWIERFERDRAARFERELQPVEGAFEVVSAIAGSGVAVCVASQGKLEKTRLSLELTGLRELFAEEQLFSAWTVRRGKPHPDLFLHAARSLGFRPGECVVVEDSPSGVQAALTAQMRAVGFAPGGAGEALREAGADPVVGALTELPLLLGIEAA
jgi:HAD superfamily hydrolase (TIGR01509 family)